MQKDEELSERFKPIVCSSKKLKKHHRSSGESSRHPTPKGRASAKPKKTERSSGR